MKNKLLSLLAVTLITVATICSSLTVEAKDVKDYSDVHAGAWYYNYVADVSAKGLMTGTNESTFTPTANLERGQFATVLYRMYQSPATDYERRFADVPDGYFYSLPVTWANNMQIVTGYENGLFGTTDYITREQMATMLYRYAEQAGMDISASADLSSFPDSTSVSEFAKKELEWAVGARIISGDQGKINPQGKVSRAVCATMISRFTGNISIDDDGAGTSSGVGSDVANLALTKVGCKYSRQKRYEEGFYDCSSLVYRLYMEFEIKLPVIASEQGKYIVDNGLEVTKDKLQPGDLIFYAYDENGEFRNISHVGIYIGNGRMVHAADESRGVVNDPYESPNIVLYGRPDMLK
ncbi:MAG: S-layer homology domain-containing protein [Muricomes sp.]